MKDNTSGTSLETNNVDVDEKDNNRDNASHVISLEEAGSVDGATPEVVSSEEDNTGENERNVNG